MRRCDKNGKVVRTVKEGTTYAYKKEPFCTPLVTMMDGTRGRRVFGEWTTSKSTAHKLYVVYAYGDHYPMYVWDEGAQAWYGNHSKYSPTTTKYPRMYDPDRVQEWFNAVDMVSITELGIVGFVQARLEGTL